MSRNGRSTVRGAGRGDAVAQLVEDALMALRGTDGPVDTSGAY